MSGPLTNQRLKDFSELSEATHRVLDQLGFEFATPVQAATIPLFTGHKDVVVDACTGSGKTLAFVLPMVEKLRKLECPLKKHQVGAVVISPTRELASQIFKVSVPFVESIPNMKACLLVGGTDIKVDFADISTEGSNVLVGTPGRLLDVFTRSKTICVSTVEILILDEADRLLDLGFEATLLSIIGKLPKQRRTGLFSATQAEAVEVLVKAGMRNPVRVNVATTKKIEGKTVPVEDLNQKIPFTLQAEFVVCSMEEKISQLVSFMSENQSNKLIVYFLTCACVDYFLLVFRRLRKLEGVFIQSLHGKMKQVGRQRAIKTFTDVDRGVLLATDVAARGLDIPDVDWVIQFDAPQDPSAFVHRVGRTARMGRAGCARIYVSADEEEYINFIRLRKVPLTQKHPDPTVDSVLEELRVLSETDREIMTKGILAFVSFVRAYANHHCSFIFRLANIDYVGLARARGLLTLPKVPEIRKFAKNTNAFIVSEVNPDDIPFRDSKRERQRQKGIRSKNGAVGETENVVQSSSRLPEMQNKSELPREKKCRNPKKRDFDELQEDYALLKLLKKGKITDKEFDEAMGFDLDDVNASAAPAAGDSSFKQSPISKSEKKATLDQSAQEVKENTVSHKGSARTCNRRHRRRGGNKTLRRKLI